MQITRCIRRMLLLVLVMSCGVLAAEDRLEFKTSSETLVLELNFEGRSVANRAAFEATRAGRSYEPPPAMRVFGDGRVVIHRYLADELRELVLSPEELRQVIEQLFSAKIHQLDEDLLHSEKAAEDQKRYLATGKVRLTTDLPTYRLDLQVDGFAPEGDEVSPIDVHESWRSLSVWAKDAYPENETVQRFVRIEELLNDLYRRVETTGTLTQEAQ